MQPTILIVEDEPAIAENIRYALETERLQPVWHATGGQVLELLAQTPVDLIILDIGLPDINGFDLCRTIRQHHSTPVLFLTARDHEIDRVVGLEIGADDYVVKPFSPRELVARVKAILRRTQASRSTYPLSQSPLQPPSSDPQSFPFVLDEERSRIVYHGTTLELSRYEYRILKILIRRPGQIFSRDHLMEMAWEEPETSLDRTVDAHIKNLRHKLKNVMPQDDPIQTHRGMGYSLKEDL